MISHRSSTRSQADDRPSTGRSPSVVRPQNSDTSSPSAHSDGSTAISGRISTNRRLHNVSFLARQLQVLLSCGTPIVQALGALERQAREDVWRALVADVRDHVSRGDSLAGAMRRHPAFFDSICCTLVEAGESSGTLELMLDRISTLFRQRLALRRAITSVLIYPALLMSAASGALAVIMTMVVPRFEQMFDSLDVPLPTLTVVMLHISTAFRTQWLILIALLVGSVAAIFFGARSTAGRRFIDTVLVTAPGIGPIIRQFATARLARLLGILVDSHVPLLDSIRLTRGAMNNVLYLDILGDAEDAVGQGEPLSSALDHRRLISPSVYEAVRSGEEAGRIGPLLVTVADFLDEDNQVTVRSLTSIIEPVILILMGLLIGLVAVSLFLPLFDLTAMGAG